MFQNNIAVLLVDDETTALRLMEERINKIENVQVVASVTDGLAAKEYLLEHPVDVVVTDICMPFMDGLELTRFVRQLDPGCKSVIISGYGEFEYARQAMQNGVREYLLKPVRARQLNEAMEKMSLEVQKKRNAWLIQPAGSNESLEKQIIKSLHHGASSDGWLLPLGELMPEGGTVVQLEQKGDIPTEKEKISGIYRNVLADGLPGNLVLRLGYQQNRFWFLILPTQTPYRRQMHGMPDYLQRVLQVPAEWSVVGEIESSAELVDIFQTGGSADKQKAVIAACEYMKTHLMDPLTRDYVAEKVFLTPCYFSSLFKKETGKGFNEYLTELRISQAKKLLAMNLPIREVGNSVGFRDSRYFSDVFRKATGYLPSQYRNALLKGEVSLEES